MGYRGYERSARTPLFPFGHGLSYTTFEWGEPSLDRDAIGQGESVTVTIPVKNTGHRAGAEVVQVYVRDVESSLMRPEKELKGFAKVTLAACEERAVNVTLDALRSPPGTRPARMGGGAGRVRDPRLRLISRHPRKGDADDRIGGVGYALLVARAVASRCSMSCSRTSRPLHLALAVRGSSETHSTTRGTLYPASFARSAVSKAAGSNGSLHTTAAATM